MNSTSRASPVSSSRAPSDEAQGKYLVVNAQNIAHNARVNTHMYVARSRAIGASLVRLDAQRIDGFGRGDRALGRGSRARLIVSVAYSRDACSRDATARRLTRVRRFRCNSFIFLSIVSGISCGILGLTGVQGFAAHLVCMLIAAGTIATVKCERRVALYFPSLDKVLIDGPNAGFGTFVLFWTLSYNCCHLY